MKYYFHPAARAEFFAAIDYYEDRSQGLGYDFSIEAHAAIKRPSLDMLQESREQFESEAKMAMAVKLFEIGRLTSGQAASLAGMPRVTFLLNCQRFGATSVEWADPQELEHEFKDYF